MKEIFRSWYKPLLIGTCAVTISTLGIQAADHANDISGRMAGMVFSKNAGPCADGEILYRRGNLALCVDSYEASPGPACSADVVTGTRDTSSNINSDCKPQSTSGVLPWRFVTYAQAGQLCARAGKRLPTNDEWHALALGQSSTFMCIINKDDVTTTGTSACVTPAGVHDMIGNLWEWTADTVTEGAYNERSLPASGYVDLVDSGGVVLRTSQSPNQDFGEDYASVNNDGVRGIVRGGFYQSGKDAGIFAQNISIALDFSGAGIGFRCVRDIVW